LVQGLQGFFVPLKQGLAAAALKCSIMPRRWGEKF
jgi:hypothetical protein